MWRILIDIKSSSSDGILQAIPSLPYTRWACSLRTLPGLAVGKNTSTNIEGNDINGKREAAYAVVTWPLPAPKLIVNNRSGTDVAQVP